MDGARKAHDLRTKRHVVACTDERGCPGPRVEPDRWGRGSKPADEIPHTVWQGLERDVGVAMVVHFDDEIDTVIAHAAADALTGETCHDARYRIPGRDTVTNARVQVTRRRCKGGVESAQARVLRQSGDLLAASGQPTIQGPAVVARRGRRAS